MAPSVTPLGGVTALYFPSVPTVNEAICGVLTTAPWASVSASGRWARGHCCPARPTLYLRRTGGPGAKASPATPVTKSQGPPLPRDDTRVQGVGEKVLTRGPGFPRAPGNPGNPWLPWKTRAGGQRGQRRGRLPGPPPAPGKAHLGEGEDLLPTAGSTWDHPCLPARKGSPVLTGTPGALEACRALETRAQRKQQPGMCSHTGCHTQRHQGQVRTASQKGGLRRCRERWPAPGPGGPAGRGPAVATGCRHRQRGAGVLRPQLALEARSPSW